MTKHILHGFAILALALLVTSGAIHRADAAPSATPVLRTNVVVEKDLVTLGDLFENTGEKSHIAVFRSPDLGKSGTVRSARVQAAAERHGLTWRNAAKITEVHVTRASTLINRDTVLDTIEKAIRARLDLPADANLTVTLGGRFRPVHLPPSDSGILEVVRLEFRSGNGHFRAQLRSTDGSRRMLDTTYRGQAVQTVQVPVLSRAVSRGDIVRDGDIRLTSVPRRKLRGGIIESAAGIIGMAARRNLQSDRPVRFDDIEKPKLVRRNTLVTIVYKHRGLTLSIRGRALADAALGEMVSVMNTRSNRIVEGTVTGHGAVAVESPGQALTGSVSQQTESRMASTQ